MNIAKWRPLSYVYKCRIAAIMYSVHNNTVSQRLANLILPEDTTHKHNLRRKKDYAHIRYNNEYGRNSFRYRGPLVWNVIPYDIRNAQTLQTFKTKLRRVSHIIDSIQFEKETVNCRSWPSEIFHTVLGFRRRFVTVSLTRTRGADVQWQ